MYTKADLREKLNEVLERHNVDDAEEIADDVVELLDEDGAFESDDEDDED